MHDRTGVTMTLIICGTFLVATSLAFGSYIAARQMSNPSTVVVGQWIIPQISHTYYVGIALLFVSAIVVLRRPQA